MTQSSGVALNYHPRFSPDGESIAFVSDRKGQDNLWVMKADGAKPRLLFIDDKARISQPSWTADGQHLVVRRLQIAEDFESEPYEIWMIPREGGEGVLLIDEDQPEVGWPSPSSDGRHLYFHIADLGEQRWGHADSLAGAWQIRRWDFPSSRVQEITVGQSEQQIRSSSGGAYAPEISPDGRRLAFVRRIPDATVSYKGHRIGPRAALWLRDLETGAERVLMDPVAFDLTASGPNLRIFPGYAWSPDGGSLFLSQGGKLRRVAVATGRVETIPFTARVKRTISEQAYTSWRIKDGPLKSRFLRWTTASPDGNRLVFQAVGKLWIQEIPEGHPRRLTTEAFTPFEYSPVWSPDGSWIAFTTFDESQNGHLWKIAAAGGAPERLTPRPGEFFNPVWATDGATLVMVRGAGATRRGRSLVANPRYELVRISSTGGAPELVTEIRGVPWNFEEVERLQIARPSFGPDHRVFFTERVEIADEESEDEAEKTIGQLVSVQLDGTNRQVHVRFPFADDAVPSPDGRLIAFQEGDNVYIAPFPRKRSGADPPLLDRRDPSSSVTALSETGGLFPRWRGRTVVEFGSADRYFQYDVETRKTDSITLDLRFPRYEPDGTLALTDARIITLDDGLVIERGSIIVEGPRIRCVGNCDLSIADHIIDARGMYIVPGFIDMHAHRHSEHRGFSPMKDFEAAAYLAYGVTTTLEPSPWSQNVFPVAELIDAGRLVGPRTFGTGDPLFHADWLRNSEIRSYRDAENEIERVRSWGAVSVKQYLQPRREQRQWVADVARKKQLMVTGEGGDLPFDLSLIMDGHTAWEHPLIPVPIYRDVARFFGQAGAIYSPTLVVGGPGPWNEEYFYQQSDVWKNPKLRRFLPWRHLIPTTRHRVLRPATDYSYPLLAQGLADIIAEGGHGAIGSHGQLHGIASHWEIWMAASALGPQGALELASTHGAYFLGVQQDLGSIEVGKLADLVILGSDPLLDIRATEDIQMVMKGGVLYDADTLDEIWPHEKPYGAYPWVDSRIFISDDRPVDYWDRAK